MLKRLILPCVLLMVVGVFSLRGQNKAAPQPKVVLRVTATGGMCPQGACGSEIKLYDDGTGANAEGPRKKSFAVGSEEMNALVALIGNTDFEALRKNKFTGLCPTAYDGQELIYSFSTPHGEEVLDSCKSAINEQSPLFKAIQKIKDKAYASEGR